MVRMRSGAIAAAVAALLALGFVACGDDDDGDGGGGAGGPSGTIIRGTTDLPTNYDPAFAYTLPDWDLMSNVYQALLTIPPGEVTPQPDAAQSCDFTNRTTYRCTLKSGLKFSDGSPLTSEDVKFSFDRNVEIASPIGASSLLANLRSVDAPDAKTVVFHLKQPESSFPYVLTTQAMAIVPSDVFPADKAQPSGEVVGSGRYTVESYEPGVQTVLERNPQYTGPDPAQNERVIVQYFDKPSALKLAVEQGQVDIAYRSLSPTDIDDLRGAESLNVLEGVGTEIRYIAFNLNLQPGDNERQKLAVRRAIAYSIDRQAIAENVWNGTVEPLYTSVPTALKYSFDGYREEYGESPDPQAARQELQQAGVQTPVDLELWYTPAHYGTAAGDEYAEIKRQLEADGLFSVTLKSSAWTQYQEAALTDKYPAFHFGWFPDYIDADNYTYSFYHSDSFLNSHYSNPEIDRLIAQERSTTEDAVRERAFEQIQRLGAEDAPIIPYFEAKQVAVVRDGVNGVEETLDPSFLFRFWGITKE
jgi:peptide/nickel transport system substrate-binding protein